MRTKWILLVTLGGLAVMVPACSSSPPPTTATSISVPTSAAPAIPAGVAAVITPERAATPDGIMVGFGAVWVVNHPAGDLDRIDPRTKHTTAFQISQGQMCYIPWIGAGHVWVGGCSYGNTVDPGRTWVVDPSSGRVVHTVPAYAIQAAFLGNSVWLENQDNTGILRFDTRTYRPTGSIAVAGMPVAGEGRLFILGEQTSSGADLRYLDQIDPRSDKVVRRIHTPAIGRYARAVLAYGAVWAIGQNTGSLLRLDVASGRVQVFHLTGDAVLSGGYEIFPLAAAGSIWVRISDSRIDRIDPRTGKVTATYPGDPNSAGMLTFGFGSLWVANVQAGTVWREPITASR